MAANNSTLPTIYPSIRYRDAAGAIRWLTRAFGLTENEVVPGPEGTILHAELGWGASAIMLGSTTDGEDGRLVFDSGPALLYLVVEDPDEHYQRAVAAGAEILKPLTDEDYGSRGYTAKDPEGNIWSFGTYQPASADAGA